MENKTLFFNFIILIFLTDCEGYYKEGYYLSVLTNVNIEIIVTKQSWNKVNSEIRWQSKLQFQDLKYDTTIWISWQCIQKISRKNDEFLLHQKSKIGKYVQSKFS